MTKRELKRRAMMRVGLVQEELRLWDPLHLAPGQLAPADEYDSYAHAIVSLIDRGAPLTDLVAHLRGLGLTDEPETETARVAAKMVERLEKS